MSALALPVLVLTAGWAHAAPVDEALLRARSAIESGNGKAALKASYSAESAAPEAEAILSTAALAQIWFYRGAAENLLGPRHQNRAMDAWRGALAIDNEMLWDTELMGEGDDWTLFEALRDEVSSRPKVGVRVPKKTGAAQIFVDGVRVQRGDSVLSGRHLGQITCDDGSMHGIWTELHKSPRWFALCPDGVDTSVVVAEVPEDEFGGMAPVFGPGPSEPFEEDLGDDEYVDVDDSDAVALAAPVVGPEAEPAPAAAPEPSPKAEPAPAPAVAAVEDPAGPSVSKPIAAVSPEPVAPRTRKAGLGVPAVSMLSGGGALVLGGGAVYFLGVVPAVNDSWDAADDPASVDRDEADDLTATARFNQRLSLGLLGGGVVLGLGGLTWGLLTDAPVRPRIGPGGLSVQGQF